MTLLPHLAARLFGVPLAIHRPKLDVILAVLGPRVGLSDLAAAPGYSPPTRAMSGSPPGVAVIPIHGTLVRRTVGLEAESGLTSYAGLAAQLDAAIGNPEVSAILLDIDSPGGESGGVFDLADRIRAASQIKPVCAVANDMAFSAAYALASAASRVFVSGQDVGVLGQVSRAGTAGDVLAPMVVDALITEAAAARQRGISVLADTGQQIKVSLRLPVLAETGIIEPGAFVEFQDGSVTRLGIVRSTQVEAGMPEVWQTLGVQSHA